MPPLKKGAYCFATVGRYVGLSICRPSVVRSISFDPFTWSIPNLVQGLHPISRWSLLIFRSNHSFEPSVLPLYILIPCLLDLDRFCFYREDKSEFCTMGAYMFLNHFFFFNPVTLTLEFDPFLENVNAVLILCINKRAYMTYCVWCILKRRGWEWVLHVFKCWL